MNKRTRPIGEILVSLGRISPADVERALTYQRENGGFFGDALVALGLATATEVNWGLADQFDLPFVHLTPEGIDRAVAALVPGAWARRHSVLPVLRDGDRVTVVVTDPRAVELSEEVRRYTGAHEVEAALTTPELLRELIDAVHGEVEDGPASVGDFLAETLAAGAREIGVSVRGGRGSGWSRPGDRGERALEGDPMRVLRERVAPFPEPPATPGELRRWRARITAGSRSWLAECHLLGTGEAVEWVARSLGEETGGAPPLQVSRELREAFATAWRRPPVVLQSVDPEADAAQTDAALPGLPALLLEREPRSIHLHDDGADPARLQLRVEGSLGGALESIAPFAFEAVTVDVAAVEEEDVAAARAVSPLVVLRARGRTGRMAGADLHVRIASLDGLPTWVIDGAD